jgi:hypothetical protein
MSNPDTAKRLKGWGNTGLQQGMALAAESMQVAEKKDGRD